LIENARGISDRARVNLASCVLPLKCIRIAAYYLRFTNCSIISI